jgi:hypothetical protein
VKPTIIALMLILCLTASAQDKIGTIIVVTGSNKQISMAADSRQTLLKSGGIRIVGHQDTGCKIVALEPDVVFASAGRVGHQGSQGGMLDWDAYAIARQIAGIGDLSPGVIADRWAAKVTKLHYRDFAAGEIDEMELALPNLEQAFLVGVADKVPTVYFVEIDKTAARKAPYVFKVRALELGIDRVVAVGHTSIVAEFNEQHSVRAKQWLHDFRVRYNPEAFSLLSWYAVSLTIQHSPDRDMVAVPIDVVEVLPTGVHWVTRKPNCKDLN